MIKKFVKSQPRNSVAKDMLSRSGPYIAKVVPSGKEFKRSSKHKNKDLI